MGPTKTTFLFIVLISMLGALETEAQEDREPLPHEMTPGEKARIPGEINPFGQSPRGITQPPDFPVRPMAEWEELQALVITWANYEDVLTEIVRYSVQESNVMIICSDSAQVKSTLSNEGIGTDNVIFLERPYDSVWMRDYGPNTVYRNGVDSLMLLDWVYNRPRPADDTIPGEIAEHLDVPLYSMTQAPYDLAHPGGNFQHDGRGTAFASKLILEENKAGNDYGVSEKTEGEIDSMMNAFMGIDRFIKMDTLPYDVIHHIDMHWKVLDEETLLVGEYPDGVADGPQIEANLDYVLSNFKSVFGDDFEVVRIPMPPENGDYPDGTYWGADYRTYTNSVIVNNTVLVPAYEEKFDTTAFRIYREAMPGYKVRGIDCNNIIEATGALHCITRSIGVEDPLLISHQPLDNTSSNDPYPVEALIRHRDGIANATLHYTTDTSSGYQSTSMNRTGPSDSIWTADIPGQAAGTEIFYYIRAEAQNGHTITRPMPAPEGYWDFKVTGPTTVPETDTPPSLTLKAIYPNPAKAITAIPVTNDRPVQGSIRVYDMLGKVVRTIHEGTIEAGESKFFLDARNLAPGSYTVILETQKGQRARKLMVKN